MTKWLLVIQLTGLIAANANAQVVSHTDPYDIKKTSVAPGIDARFNYGLSGRLKIGQYVHDRVKFSYTGSIGIPSGSKDNRYRDNYKSSMYRPDEAPELFMNHELECDLHIIDHEKPKVVNVVTERKMIRHDLQEVTISQVESSVRRILSVSGGFQRMVINEMLYDSDDKDPFYLFDIEQNKVVKLNDKDPNTLNTLNSAEYVFTDGYYSNFFIGPKFKAITATGVTLKNGLRLLNGIELETYFHVIFPIQYDYYADVYKDLEDFSYTHRIIDNKPKTGFRAGITARHCLRNYSTGGVEIGVRPTIAPLYSRGLYFTLFYGFNLNFGKVTYQDE